VADLAAAAREAAVYAFAMRGRAAPHKSE